MEKIKDDGYFVDRIMTDLDFMIKHTTDIPMEEFYRNELLIDSILFRMIQISENVKRLSKDFKDSNGSVPWTSIIGLRNLIVHEYGKVDLAIVIETVNSDIPKLRELLKILWDKE